MLTFNSVCEMRMNLLSNTLNCQLHDSYSNTLAQLRLLLLYSKICEKHKIEKVNHRFPSNGEKKFGAGVGGRGALEEVVIVDRDFPQYT